MIDLDNTSFDRCIKCTICTAYCPVARVSPLYPGPKYSGPDAERMRIKTPFLADSSLAYCNNCKRCETVCPSGVRIADFISLARSTRLKKRRRIRNFLLTHTDLAGFFATRLAWPANFLLGLGPVKTVLGLFLNISVKIRFPAYASGRFSGELKAQTRIQKAFPEQVLYFYGCYVNYNFHDLGRDVVAVLNAMNIGVIAPAQKCCGVPLIAAGNLARAKKNANANIQSLAAAVKGTDRKIVFSSSSCILAVQQDYPELLDMDTSSIDGHIEFITRFLYKKFKAGNLPALKPLNLTATYHSPCHLERTGGVMYTIEVLRRIPGLQLTLLHSECCGLAGTYGFKKEFETLAEDIGQPLFRQIRATAPDVVITDCEACKWQIEAHTGLQVLHPVSVLAMALAKF